jgi:hypothetical protein
MSARKYFAELVGTVRFGWFGYASLAAIGHAGLRRRRFNPTVVPFSFGRLLVAIVAAATGGWAFNLPSRRDGLNNERRGTEAVGYILARARRARRRSSRRQAVTVSQTRSQPGIRSLRRRPRRERHP